MFGLRTFPVHSYSGALAAGKAMGAKVVEADVTDVVVDDENKVVTTPAFMKNTSFFNVFTGVGKMVHQVLKLA